MMDGKQLTTITKNDQEASSGMTQFIRHCLQIAGFLLMPGLFLLTLHSVKGLWHAIISGSFTWAAMGAPLLTLLAIIPITALWGRFFCGYLCSFGGLQELMGIIGQTCQLPQLTVPPAIDRVLKKMKYVVLAALFLLWTLDISYDSASPWAVFGQYATYDGWRDLHGWLTIGGLLLVLIIVGSLFTERAFCRYLCPLGGIFSLISRWRLFKIKKNGNCVGCGHCEAVCPMGIAVRSDSDTGGRVNSAECIDCFRCIDKCGVKALHTSPREAVAGSAAAVAVAGLYQVGTIAVKPSLVTLSNSTSLSQGQYIDGTYEGSAQGYRGTVTVQVVVSNGMISSITVESYRDDDEFFNRAKNTVINEIITRQTTDVSTVSGATYSSRGIMQAVANALGVTQTFDMSDDAEQRNHDTETNHTPETNPNAAVDFSQLTDGTYSGSGQGRNGTITVSVKVKGGKVTSITVENSREDEQYFNRAKDTVIGEIIESQSLNVQTVSGATMSSNGIIDAVANALGISYTNPNRQQGAKGSHHSNHGSNQGRGRKR